MGQVNEFLDEKFSRCANMAFFLFSVIFFQLKTFQYSSISMAVLTFVQMSGP